MAKRPGFTLPGKAAEAGRTGHALGVTRQWTAEEAREQARRGAERRWEREKPDGRNHPDRRGE